MVHESGGFALAPVTYFQLQQDIVYSQGDRLTLLPDTSQLTNESPFADVSMGWHEEGLDFFIHLSVPYTQTFYPELQKGDSVELFIDTRDVKTSGYNTRFCHHFYFLPEKVAGLMAGEITQFRTEDRHEYADSHLLDVHAKMKKNSYELKIHIPSVCLYGYDPSQFDRLGFCYRINQVGGISQHFTALSEEFPLERQPSLWSSCRLVSPLKEERK